MTETIKQFFEGKRVCVTGGSGFLGRVVVQQLETCAPACTFIPRSGEFDLTSAEGVERMMTAARPDIVIHLAAEVGGIGANQASPGRFFYANMAMGLHLIEASRKRGVQRFVQVGTVCAYPKHCPLPFCEDDLWSGYPEETNAPYGVAKRALGTMLEAYQDQYDFPGAYVIPVNLYGPGDNFDLETSHVIPALIRKFESAVQNGRTEVTCWGTGRASREFLYVDDAAAGILIAAAALDAPTPVNLGTCHEIEIATLAGTIAELCGFRGKIIWDASRPDGQPRRKLDVSRAEALLGWKARVSLEEGLRRTLNWWRQQGASGGRADSSAANSTQRPATVS